MGNLIMPKHTAEIIYFESPLEVLNQSKAWLSMEDFVSQLANLVIQKGREEERHSDDTHYTKCAQLPKYFGFIDAKREGGVNYLKINENGSRFLSALKVNDKEVLFELLIRSIEVGCFGKENIGVPSSRSDIDPPAVFLRACIDLDFLTRLEYAYLLNSLVNRNDDYTNSIDTLKRIRSSKSNIQKSDLSTSYTDAKPITFLANMGLLTSENGLLKIDSGVFSKYEKRLRNLKIYSVDKDVIDEENASSSVQASHELMPQQPRQPELIPLQDRLTIALKVFEAHRVKGDEPFTCVTEDELTKINESYDYAQLVDALKDELKGAPKHISAYLADNTVRANASYSLLTRLLVTERPDIYSACTEQTAEALHFLDLTKTKALPKDLTADAYESSKAIQTQIRDKMREMKILSQEGKEANYLTVAEFLWFVNDNKDLIEGKVMEKQFKPVNATPIDNEGPRKEKHLECKTTDDVLIFRLMAALRTKPFAILAGHSGTGKSRLVRKLAYMTCNVKELQNTEKNSPENFCMVQVKPNWHDSMDLLGYRSAFEDKSYVTTDVVKFICKAYAYPDTPFFLCLDEMNLAPVEQYFAEFLSAMESLRERKSSDAKKSYTSDTLFTLTDDEIKSQSKLFDLGCETSVGQTYLTKRGGVTIPKNLFVVGTVNMDETTCQFSRKVLDRAMTIEMTDVNFANFGKVKDPSFEDLLAEDIVQLLLDGDIKVESLDAEDVDVNSKLCKLQECLKETSFAIAYRFAKEYTLFKRAIEEFKEHISGSPQKSEDESSEVAETPEDSRPSEASNSGMRETVENLDALDQMVLMKVLPRIMGRTEDVKALFTGVRDFNPEGSKEPMSGSLLNIFGKMSKSGKKMIEIMGRGGSHLTFWP